MRAALEAIRLFLAWAALLGLILAIPAMGFGVIYYLMQGI